MRKLKIKLGGWVKVFDKEDADGIVDFAYKYFQNTLIEDFLKDVRVGTDRIKGDFKRLICLKAHRLVKENFVFKKSSGIKIANYFCYFRFMLRADKQKSPIFDIEKKKRLRFILKRYFKLNRPPYKIKESTLLSVSTLIGTQGLGNFLPAVAKGLYDSYCEENGKILDPSFGFGGRLVGAMSSGRNFRYVGVDPSSRAFESVSKLVDFLNVKNRVELIKQPFEDSEQFLGEDNSFDFCFTSPPYFKNEIYSDELTQSCNRYKEISVWRELFLRKMFEIVHRKLKKGKYFLLNISNVKIRTKVVPLEDIAVEEGLRAGFDCRKKLLMVMTRMPNLKSKEKTEPIFVFRKHT